MLINNFEQFSLDTFYVVLPAGNLSSGRRSSRIGGAPAILELVIVVDKEFGDLFSHNYYQIVDYLTVYFWDINIRFKSLTSVDLSLRVNGLLIMEVGTDPYEKLCTLFINNLLHT